MLNVAGEWLRSGKVASLDGIELHPLPHPAVSKVPLAVVRGQATAYFLRDRQNRDWILKKFLPGRDPEVTYIRAIRSLVPNEPGFESGSQRRVLTWKEVGRGFGTPEFGDWIENTILMPRVGGLDWLYLAESLRDGTTSLGEETRVAICTSLVRRVRALENAGLSHRDLSITNVFIDPATWEVHLIDWDALYHRSLALPANTTVGTSGYTAPFVMTGAGEDARRTWCPLADRFAMAILCTEFLILDQGSELANDGGLFEQRDLYARGGTGLQEAILELTVRYPEIGRLVERCLRAQTFAACPSPDEWLVAPPLSKPVHAPALRDLKSFMGEFDRYIKKLQEKRPPVPPAPRLPIADFSAAIQKALAPPLPAPPAPRLQDFAPRKGQTTD